MSSMSPTRKAVLPRFAEIAVERARLSVVPRLRQRAPRIPFVTLVSLILLAGVIGLLLFNTSMQQASFTASQLETQARDLSARQQALTMEIDGLRDPARLAAAACAAGMVVAPTAAFLDVTTGVVTGTPTPAVAAPCGSTEPRPKPPAAQAAAAADVPADPPARAASGESHAQPLKFGR